MCVSDETECSNFHGFTYPKVTNSGLDQQRIGGTQITQTVTWNSVDISG